MLYQHLKLFFRQFQRQKVFSSINILGLSSGICTSLIIYLYVSHELSYDKFHKDVEDIYRINQTFIWGDDVNEQFGSTGPGVSMALAADIPEVKHITRLHPHGDYLVTRETSGNQILSFNERNILAADSNFFEVFTFPLIKGDEKTALINPKSLILTESTAEKYFNKEDPMGQILSLELNGNIESYSVTGVLKDQPTNSHIQFDMLMSMSSIPRVKKQNWTWIWTTFVTFVKFEKGTNIELIRDKIQALPEKYAGLSLQRIFNTTYEEFTKDGRPWQLYLQPLTDIHLSSNSLNRINAAGNIQVVIALSGAAIFIIILSCINFMNLSTSQYLTRAKFTGIRKILGSSKAELTKGFMIEAVIYCSISLIIGAIAVQFLLPYFNNVLGQELSFDLFNDPSLLIVTIGLTLIMSLLAGSYPSIFLSTFNVVDTLKGKLKSGKDGQAIRNSLVVVQFASTVILISCTMIVYQQLAFTKEKDVGFNRENLLSVNNLEWIKNADSFVNELENVPGVDHVSLCTSMPPSLWGGDQFKPVDSPVELVALNYTTADENYIPALEISLVDGRNFNEDINEERHIILNQSAVKAIGWDPKESVIGKKIRYSGFNEPFEVIGVVSDFNYWSLEAPIEPFALFNNNSGMYAGDKQFAAISFAESLKGSELDALKNSLALIESKWNQFADSRPYEYHFVDDAFAATFESQDQMVKVLTIFAGLAILIALLGLFGIIIFTIDQRTKEIGIRKVVGAQLWHIAVLLTKGHIKLIAFSVTLAIPVSLWLMNNWLADFRHRIEISPLTFFIAGAGIISMAMIISGYHSFRAAQTNPVEVLKDE